MSESLRQRINKDPSILDVEDKTDEELKEILQELIKEHGWDQHLYRETYEFRINHVRTELSDRSKTKNTEKGHQLTREGIHVSKQNLILGCIGLLLTFGGIVIGVVLSPHFYELIK